MLRLLLVNRAAAEPAYSALREPLGVSDAALNPEVCIDGISNALIVLMHRSAGGEREGEKRGQSRNRNFSHINPAENRMEQD